MGKRITIVGAGPAGLMAAIAAAGGGAEVVVCEQLDRVGAKLLATGGGRCNLTNTAGEADFLLRFGRHGRFIQPALAGLDGAGLREFMLPLGVKTYVAEGGQVYPSTNRAGDVRNALLDKARQLGVEFRLGTTVKRLLIDAGRLTGVETSEGPISAGAVIVGTGGKSYAALGGTGGGYALAAQAGHTISPLLPALVGLVTAEKFLAGCAGVSFRGRIWIDLPRRPKAGISGDILITHRGLSGPAMLDLSGDVAELLGAPAGQDCAGKPARPTGVPVRIEMLAGRGREYWLAEMDRWQRDAGRRRLEILLAAHMPARLAEVLCDQAQCLETLAAHASRAQRESLAGLLSALPLIVRDTEDFDSAIVTRGGVSLKEVDPHTLQSRLLPGLYFAGEVLDLDGPCGGYNLQWAFSSGSLAGLSAGE